MLAQAFPLHDSLRGEPRVAPLVLSSTSVLSEHLRRDVGAQAALGEDANSALISKNSRETPAGAASEEEEQQENNAQKWRVGDVRNVIILLPEAKYGHGREAGLKHWKLLQFRLPPLTIEGIHHSDADLGRGGAQQCKITNNWLCLYIICEYDGLPDKYCFYLYCVSSTYSITIQLFVT